MSRKRESGVALITTVLVLLLMSALLIGFTMMVMTDQRLGAIERDRNQALYAAHAGQEKLTSDLGTLFSGNAAPTGALINGLQGAGNEPVLPGITYAQPGGGAGSGYQITFPPDANGNPLAQNRTILSGPYQGFIGLITPYTMTVTARSANGAEVRLRRVVQTVGIPVFQFGIFSETDLSFFAGPNFNFGGRTHTNGNLYLAEGSGNTLTMGDRVTAVGEVIRTNLSNGWPTSTNYTGTVNVIRAPSVFRALGSGEGSLVGTIGTAWNEPTWTNLSIGTYNGNLRNGRTGARLLTLPLATLGAQPIDLIRRPPPNEDVNNPNVLAQRYFNHNPGDQICSLRILLSDTPQDILNLPTVTATAPINLNSAAAFPIAPGTAITGGGRMPPLAFSPGNTGANATAGYRAPVGTPLIGGYIKIEMRTAAAWVDVTQEILSLGMTGRNLSTGVVNTASANCGNLGEPNPNAIIRLERLRDVPAANAPCGYTAAGAAVSTNTSDYWPLVLFDTREGDMRDNISTAQATLYVGGLMHYVELDVRNLSRWFQGAIGLTGNQAISVNGYVVYFSDRRGDRDNAGNETGEYGFEDIVNPASTSATPNGIMDTGEDLNTNGTLETYGVTPRFPFSAPFGGGAYAPAGGNNAVFTAPLDAAARPWTTTNVTPVVGRANPPIFFRRALKLVNGSLGNIVLPGLTIASENPVYVQGDYNASVAGGFGVPHAATSVIADAVSFLSNNWNDIRSFVGTTPAAPRPHDSGVRAATTTWYRLAIISGKGLSFPQPGSTPQDYGTDGGVHNFLRYIENWSGQTLNYRGSIVSFYYNRQGIGIYKCCNNVYRPPSRGYNFDTDFLTPTLLPPRTPMFRDVNTIGFTQIVNPNQP